MDTPPRRAPGHGAATEPFVFHPSGVGGTPHSSREAPSGLRHAPAGLRGASGAGERESAAAGAWQRRAATPRSLLARCSARPAGLWTDKFHELPSLLRRRSSRRTRVGRASRVQPTLTGSSARYEVGSPKRPQSAAGFVVPNRGRHRAQTSSTGSAGLETAAPKQRACA